MAKLVIAEKPAVAGAIAPVIGADKKNKGYYDGNGYIVSWCYGHLVHMKNPDDYGGKWAEKPWSFEMLPMIPELWQFAVGKDCKEQFGILKTLMQSGSVDEIICATDADREGECIFRYVYNLIGCRKPVRRLWISSLEESAVKHGFSHLKNGQEYNNLFAAGFCRAKADWLVGMNGSRLFSIRYHQGLHLGRVQTPTLAMIVQRDEDMTHFVKQKYFTVMLNCGAFSAESDRINDEHQAAALCISVTGKTVQIVELTKENKVTNPPKLYDLTTLQRECNKYFGYTAQQTLDALQKLYEAKLATYPRTDSQYLSEDMEQTALQVCSVIGKVYPELSHDSPDLKHCINNKKVTGHHAIIPTERISGADLQAMPVEQKNVLYLISAKLAMASALPNKYESTKVIIRCEKTDFKASGKMILDEGWKAIEGSFRANLKQNESSDDAAESVQMLPVLAQGQSFENVAGSTQTHWTSPPKPFTEDTLLTAMEHAGLDEYDENSEKKGLGTPATRADVIERLVSHGYIERKKKQIIPTDKGKNLIAAVPDEVKSPKLTAEWEMQLQQIEHGKMNADDFMNQITAFVRKICATYSTTDDSISFRKEAEPIGKCPNCGGDVLNGKYGFYCTKKCGMYLGKVYGNALTESQLKALLSGKQTSFMRDGKKTIVLPEVEKHEYQGKTSFQWKTR